MLSYPDFEQKQILFIQLNTEIKTDFKFSNDNIVIYNDGKIKNKISLHKIFVIYFIGSFTITSNLIEKLQQFAISAYFLKSNFGSYGAVETFASGNYLLRYQQYHLTDAVELNFAKKIVANKILNQSELLKKIDKSQYSKAKLLEIKSKIGEAIDSQSLLGIEGSYAKGYFQTIFQNHNWIGRRPRVKHDINNFLLDFGYSYLFNLIDSLLRVYGFDTYKGIYHKLFFQRKSLSCDLQEPFRVIIDNAIIRGWNLKIVDPEEFEDVNGVIKLDYKLNSKYSRYFTEQILDRKKEIFDYIRQYYRHNMAPKDNPFPIFKYKIR
jgi:CRISP-associated protein Cas1